MHSSQSSISCILFVASLFYISFIGTVEGKATWTCTPCISSDDCDLEPIDFCVWGETRNFCGRRVCAKGPGERCGGKREVFGKCGAGMWCQKEEESNHETCHGCYDNSLDCHRSMGYK